MTIILDDNKEAQEEEIAEEAEEEEDLPAGNPGGERDTVPSTL